MRTLRRAALLKYVLVWNKSLQMQRLPAIISWYQGSELLWAKSGLLFEVSGLGPELAKVSSDMEVLDFQAHPGRSQFSAVVKSDLPLLLMGPL